jgi:hypothetical protein
MKKDISAVLKWEGILIDPIGALVAVLVYEFIIVGEGHNYTQEALIEFGKIVIIGFSIGFTSAYALYYAIKHRVIPHYLLNVITLATVLGVFVLSDLLAKESGLLTVVIMGMVLGNQKISELKEILYFKESMSILLISILFILLAAHINIEEMLLIYNWNALFLFLVVVFLLRPLGVFLSTYKSTLKFNEKLFISWVGPRGIVAAGIASLFGLKLVLKGEPGAEFITPLVFMIVLGTVILNAATARIFAKIFGVFLTTSNGILIVGASTFSRVVAKYLMNNDRRVVVIDRNEINVEKAKKEGIEALEADIFNDDLIENVELNDIGYLYAFTGSTSINDFAIQKYGNDFGENGAFRLISEEEINNDVSIPAQGVFSITDDFINISEVARNFPSIHEVKLTSVKHFKSSLESLNKEQYAVPLFIKDKNGFHKIITSTATTEVEAGNHLVYLGKKLKI